MLVKRFNAPNVFIDLFKILYSTTPALISSVGIIPVVRVLWNFRSFIIQGYSNINNLQVIYSYLNSDVVNTLIEPISPYIKECLKYPELLKTFLNYYFILISLTFIKPLIFKLMKWSIGLILTSIGVLWNESLQGIYLLKDLSLKIIELLEYHSKIHIPRLDINNIKTINTDINLDESDKREITSNILTYLGLYLLGISSIILVMVASDYIAPDITRSVPYVGNILDNIYNGFHSIYNWLFNKPSPPGSGSEPNPGFWDRPILPDSITRSNSSESNITIRDLRSNSPVSPITPPSTPQVLPVERDYSEDMTSNG